MLSSTQPRWTLLDSRAVFRLRGWSFDSLSSFTPHRFVVLSPDFFTSDSVDVLKQPLHFLNARRDVSVPPFRLLRIFRVDSSAVASVVRSPLSRTKPPRRSRSEWFGLNATTRTRSLRLPKSLARPRDQPYSISNSKSNDSANWNLALFWRDQHAPFPALFGDFPETTSANYSLSCLRSK